ncbi:unnamed protein product [Brassica oleracea]|uniref:(rape) hypothetical protein n=1 Tax=Brassica napus TaxID=3708 RepID=A0A816I1P3_BRANA|nr:unnamed protein product [Brassica napus]
MKNHVSSPQTYMFSGAKENWHSSITEREREVLIISSRKRSKGRQTRQRQERRKQRRSATPSDPPREKLTQIRLKSNPRSTT